MRIKCAEAHLMRETRLSGSVEGVVSNHDPYSDSRRRNLLAPSPIRQQLP